ncbi:MAG: TIGR03915 family putative DNA repair protein [Spirochaetes bacterium]|nr:TIGR03915 family putative DNA repair protein [Spirochaetota bacterium]
MGSIEKTYDGERVNADDIHKGHLGSAPAYDGTIFSIFSILDFVFRENRLLVKINSVSSLHTKPLGVSGKGIVGDCSSQELSQGELFNEMADDGESQKDFFFTEGTHEQETYKYFEPCRNSFSGQEIIKYSGRAYKDILYAWMSELSLEREIIHFAWKIVAAGRAQCEEQNAGYGENGTRKEKLRRGCSGGGSNSAKQIAKNADLAVGRVMSDLADMNIKKVIDAARKARQESHFFLGILRFSVGANNVAIARCAPDHFILPTLAHHFTRRFGDSRWAILDEKRNILLMRDESELAKLLIFDPEHPWFKEEKTDDWEKMWKNYHTSINNESRSNSKLQRSFIPLRYWKYLPEFPAERA